MSGQETRPVVGIVGGGFTGAVVALHLARALGNGAATEIVIFEPRERLGAGLAYDTEETAHRINVPAARMSAYPDDPESFLRWLGETGALEHDPEAFSVDGVPFPRREVFGRYVAAQLAPLLASGAVRHERTYVNHVERSGSGWALRTKAGGAIFADVLVLAVSHPPPSLPSSLSAVAGHPKLIADATKPNALAAIGPQDRVLVIGNGLSAADVIAAIRHRGHRGPITALSRRGLRPRGHPKVAQDPFGDFVTRPSTRASQLLRRVRRSIALANEAGLSWHAVLDAVRSQAQAIWAQLPIVERRRIVRHARPFWDVHRFRIAPQVEQALDVAIENHDLNILAASLLDAKTHGDAVRVSFRKKGQTERETVDFDAVVVTTGPAHGGILRSQRFIAGLADAGLLTLCPTGLGILNDVDARALTAQGERLETLLIAGPLARGTVGELMGLPQVTEHAVLVAGNVAELLRTKKAAGG